VRAQQKAILDNRLLLSDPDPTAPLITKVSYALRAAVSAAAEAAQAAHGEAIAELEQSAEWKQLDEPAHDSLLAEVGLSPIIAPPLATDDELLRALDSVSLPSWRERREALPAKAAAVRAAASKQLEPKSVALKPPAATIKTSDDVDAYLVQLREILMRHVHDDETIIL